MEVNEPDFERPPGHLGGKNRVVGAEGEGGNLSDVKVLNKVLASTDIVAIDAYAATLLGHKPEDISVTVAAHQRGLGEINLKKVRLVRA